MRITRRLTATLIMLCLVLLLMGAPLPPSTVLRQSANAQVGCPPDLILIDPEVFGCRVRSNGVATTSCDDPIVRINWQWGDGVSYDAWFPTHHRYPYTGSYNMTVTAHTEAGHQASETKLVNVGCNNENDYYGLIVGVADYPDPISDLRYAVEDALDMKNALFRYVNWEEPNYQLLLDVPATKTEIRAGIQQIAARATSDDVVLFFFSGYGTNGPDVLPMDEADGVDEYLCAYGSSLEEFIRDDELSQWLGTLPTNNVIVILDASYSGGEIQTASGTPKSLPGTPVGAVQEGDGFAADLTSRISPMDMGGNAGCVVLTASAEQELSYELAPLRNGLFTFFAVHGLERYLDLDRNNELAAEELFLFPRIGLRLFEVRFGLNQHPQMHDDYPAGSPSSGRLGVGLWPPYLPIAAGGREPRMDSVMGELMTGEEHGW